jgi:CelD/BcsL family acetyltransferase involved in cellulose biosynthesis
MTASAAEVLARLPKKTRWTIRKGEAELRGRGTLTYQEITSHDSAPGLIEDIYSIEARSWKHGAGTAITSQSRQQEFYEALIPCAAIAGVLSAHVLRLDNYPIAYILGIAADDGVFLDLKESFDQTYSGFSPGHVLKKFAIEALIARGTRTYDFMGNCEDYKMRWTDRTYRVETLSLVNRNLIGRLIRFRQFAKAVVDRLREPSATLPSR